MASNTKIEWTDKTWNPVTGCTKVSQGCKHCYAERVFPRPYPGRAFTDVRCHEDRLDQPLHWKKPAMVFVNSMSDLFHDSVPDEFIDRVVAVTWLSTWHTFQILTKRPERAQAYFAGLTFERCRKWMNLSADGGEHRPGGYNLTSIAHKVRGGVPHRTDIRLPLANVWLGVSVEDQKTADERIPLLLQTPAAVRFVSYEPALGLVDLARGMPHRKGGCGHVSLDWVICGGESGPDARPMHPDWARSVRDQCVAAGVPFFFKQWGEWAQSNEPVEAFRHETGNFETVPANLGFIHIGKRAAGSLLDGREWKQCPPLANDQRLTTDDSTNDSTDDSSAGGVR